MVQIVAGTMPEDYLYNTVFLPCFLSFVRNLTEIQLTNNAGVTVIAIVLT